MFSLFAFTAEIGWNFYTFLFFINFYAEQTFAVHSFFKKIISLTWTSSEAHPCYHWSRISKLDKAVLTVLFVFSSTGGTVPVGADD